MKKNDSKIKDLLAKVEEQEKEVTKKGRSTLITNGVFPKPDGKPDFNLNTVTDPNRLVVALAFLIRTKHDMQVASEELGVDYKFQWGGYSYEDWREDFIERIESLKRQEKKKQLATTKKKLNSMVSEEAKTAMELDEIAKLLG